MQVSEGASFLQRAGLPSRRLSLSATSTCPGSVALTGTHFPVGLRCWHGHIEVREPGSEFWSGLAAHPEQAPASPCLSVLLRRRSGHKSHMSPARAASQGTQLSEAALPPRAAASPGPGTAHRPLVATARILAQTL